MSRHTRLFLSVIMLSTARRVVGSTAARSVAGKPIMYCTNNSMMPLLVLI
jgi:hypothetical protein